MGASGFDGLLRHLAQPEPSTTKAATKIVDAATDADADTPAGEERNRAGGPAVPTPAPNDPQAVLENHSEVAAAVTGTRPPEARPITPEEISFLGLLAPFVPTPRSATRLFNIYGMLRSTGNLSEGARFLGGREQPGHYEAVAQLLAILTASPELFGLLLWGRRADGSMERRALCRAGPRDTWTLFVDGLEPVSTNDCWGNDVADAQTADEAEAWRTLVRRLKGIRDQVHLDDIEPYRRWGPLVARFSFVVAAHTADEPETALDATAQSLRVPGATTAVP
jgi:hypothetical protein